jgi:integrase
MTTTNETRTVNEIFDRFVKDVIPDLRPQTQRVYLLSIKTLRKYFGTRIASTLVPADFQDFMSVSSGKAHRNAMLRTFSSVVSKAVRDWKWLNHNVVFHVRRHEIKAHTDRHVSDEDFDAVLQTAPVAIQHVMKLCMFTARNPIEFVRLKWSQVHDKEILLRDPTTDQKVSIKITPAIRAVLDECRKLAGSSAYLINTASKTKHGKPYTHDGFRAMWQREMRKWQEAGHDRFTFHDIRATAQARLEQQLTPVAGEGHFIGAGDVLDAYTAMGKVLGTAKVDVLIVDPYMDEKAVTDFAPLVSQGVTIRLLADAQGGKPTLGPAAKRWATQYGSAHPLEVRVAAARSLHDRLIVIDEQEAWILTQSLKDFAARSPASIVRVDRQIAEMKIAAYEALWLGAQAV